jgi:hypothetical protein
LYEFGKARKNVRTFGTAAKIRNGDLEIEKCDTTSSPNNESPSETGDSDVDRNYSLSDDSYLYSSDSNISYWVR